jgi:hypothetical protein
MSHATVINTVLRAGDFKIQAPRRPLCIVKEKVFVHFDKEAPQDESLWYPKSGLTNHMSGCRGAFINIDTAIHDNVKFGYGSEVAIEGSSIVLF